LEILNWDFQFSPISRDNFKAALYFIFYYTAKQRKKYKNKPLSPAQKQSPRRQYLYVPVGGKNRGNISVPVFPSGKSSLLSHQSSLKLRFDAGEDEGFTYTPNTV